MEMSKKNLLRGVKFPCNNNNNNNNNDNNNSNNNKLFLNKEIKTKFCNKLKYLKNGYLLGIIALDYTKK